MHILVDPLQCSRITDSLRDRLPAPMPSHDGWKLELAKLWYQRIIGLDQIVQIPKA